MEEYSNEQLDINKLKGVFYLLVIGVVVSFMGFISEFYCFSNTKNIVFY
jgi:hypothetical protein